MLMLDQRRVLKCYQCKVEVDTRCGGYWFLLMAPRGRVRFPGAQAAESVLCSGCGRRLRELLESGCYAPGPAYLPDLRKSRGGQKHGSKRNGPAVGDGVPVGTGGERRRAIGDGGLVQPDWAGAASRVSGFSGEGP